MIEKQTAKTNFGAVAIKKVDELANDCSQLQELVDEHDIDLIIFIPNWELNAPFMTFYNYGCEVLESNMATSVMNVYERQTWIYEEEKKSARETVLLYNLYIQETEKIDQHIIYEQIQDKPSLILVKNNDKTLSELSTIFGFPLYRHTYYQDSSRAILPQHYLYYTTISLTTSQSIAIE